MMKIEHECVLIYPTAESVSIRLRMYMRGVREKGTHRIDVQHGGEYDGGKGRLNGSGRTNHRWNVRMMIIKNYSVHK